MSEPAIVMDLLRQTTAEGSRAKKGQDRTGQEAVHLLAPVVISGEGFDALATEKALRDRAIILDVPSPTSRMSLNDPERAQWDDILALKARYSGDLTKVAGTLGGLALECTDLIDGMKGLRIGKGRWGDKMSVLGLGAQMLDRMTGDDRWFKLTTDWAGGVQNLESENLLTMTILPRLLAEYGTPTSAKGNLPVFVDRDGLVWFHEASVSNAWGKLARTPRERQLGSIEAIRSQRQALGVTGRGKRLRTGHTSDGRDVMAGYHGLSEPVSRGIQERMSQTLTLSGGQNDVQETLL
jgi:hypothetical protein